MTKFGEEMDSNSILIRGIGMSDGAAYVGPHVSASQEETRSVCVYTAQNLLRRCLPSGRFFRLEY